MPFKSKKQAQWMKENRPELYEEFKAATENFDKLPIRSPAEKEKRKKERLKHRNGKKARTTN